LSRRLHCEEAVEVDRKPGVVVSYRMTERGQLCRVRLVDAAGLIGPGECVELLASSPRISRCQHRDSLA